eukprot:SAG31_NODE_3770_length_3900_cov_4.289924_2_plen_61_part_00
MLGDPVSVGATIQLAASLPYVNTELFSCRVRAQHLPMLCVSFKLDAWCLSCPEPLSPINY